MSTSPFFSIARRVDSSGTIFITRRLTDGVFRQYFSCASRTISTPGWWLTSLYGPAPQVSEANKAGFATHRGETMIPIEVVIPSGIAGFGDFMRITIL